MFDERALFKKALIIDRGAAYEVKMRKIYSAIFATLAIGLLFCSAFAMFAFGAEEKNGAESTVCTGIIVSATDINGDSVLDGGGKIEIKLFLESRAGEVTLSFTEEEFCALALTFGEEKKVNLAVGGNGYAVNTVLSMEYYGELSLLENESFTAAQKRALKRGFAAAQRKKGSATVLPSGNEVYSTYLSLDIGGRAELCPKAAQSGFSAEYDAATDTAKITYRGVTYTAAKRLGGAQENPLVVTENGEPLAFSEICTRVKSLAEGEMLALFGDTVQNEGEEERVFELLDLKKSRDFAPVSEEFNPCTGVCGKEYSYVLFDSEARMSVPYGRTFSARKAEGAGLCLVLCAAEASGYYESASALCFDAEKGEYVSFVAVHGEKVMSAKENGDYVEVTFESGKSALLPGKALLENKEMSAELFYELYGFLGSKSVKINAEQSSWFASLAKLYGDGASLEGAKLTVVFGADGKALYAEVN